jgi:Protein of unknown function (DUF3024)
MPVPPEVLEPAIRHVEAFCANRVPEELRDEMRLEHTVRGSSITIIERRAPWSDLIGPAWTSMKIAQFRYDERSATWTLYAPDRNERWHVYDFVEPAGDLGPLLAEVEDDPTGIFWG